MAPPQPAQPTIPRPTIDSLFNIWTLSKPLDFSPAIGRFSKPLEDFQKNSKLPNHFYNYSIMLSASLSSPLSLILSLSHSLTLCISLTLTHRHPCEDDTDLIAWESAWVSGWHWLLPQGQMFREQWRGWDPWQGIPPCTPPHPPAYRHHPPHTATHIAHTHPWGLALSIEKIGGQA